MLGPGWQQEHGQMAGNRGYGQAGKYTRLIASTPYLKR